VTTVIGLLIATGLLYQYVLHTAKHSQPWLMEMATYQIANTQFMAAEDTQFLAGRVEVREYLAAPSPSRRQALEQMFKDFLQVKGHIDQARLLSPNGQELVRVNYNQGAAIAVPLSNLQDKSSRYYFQKALDLKKNQVFVSKADLNVEQNIIEEPHKPVQRMVMPVYLHDHLEGYLVLNFNAHQIFEHIIQLNAFNDGPALWLVNRQGYWLHKSNAGHPWGFMLPERAGENLNAKYPELWQQIQHSNQGYFAHDGTIYFYQHLNTKHLSAKALHLPTLELVLDEDSPWILISHQTALSLWIGNKPNVFYMVLLIPILTGLVFWWLLRRNAKFESDLTNKEHYLNAITEQLVEALMFVDEFGCIRDANRAAVDIFGYPVEELLDLHISQLMPPEHRAVHEGHFRQAFQHAGRANYFMNHVVQAMTKEGNIISIKMVISSIRDDDKIFFICSARDVTEELRNMAKLKELAETDPLTGLLNTKAFYERAKLELKRAIRKDSSIGILFIDVDHFKKINDRFGHLAGDDVLTKVAYLLRSLIRGYDLVGRPGGDEFVVLMPETNENTLVALIERLQAGIASLVLDVDPELRLSLSIGGVISTTEDEHALNDLINTADKAMYAAKNQGRGRFVLARNK
jgi:diguanylate cyclase (GGDEF)-like protein/PAS domain S-box-containing protein